jgi:hypothetical protein
MKRRDLLRAAAAGAMAACVPTTTTPTATGDVVASMSLERKVGQLMSVAFRGRTITSSLDSREPSLTAAAEVLLGERKPSGSLPAVVPGVFAIGAGMRDFA